MSIGRILPFSDILLVLTYSFVCKKVRKFSLVDHSFIIVPNRHLFTHLYDQCYRRDIPAAASTMIVKCGAPEGLYFELRGRF
jgi:hypothetical protein